MFHGYRKLILAFVSIISGVALDSFFQDGISYPLSYLVIGVYASFALSNVAEHVCRVFKRELSDGESSYNISLSHPSETHSLDTERLLAIEQSIAKLLQYQESSLKALEFLVGYVNQANAQQTK